jgi:hypothetical protein
MIVFFDVNLNNIATLVNGGIKRCDLIELYHIYRVYKVKR